MTHGRQIVIITVEPHYHRLNEIRSQMKKKKIPMIIINFCRPFTCLNYWMFIVSTPKFKWTLFDDDVLTQTTFHNIVCVIYFYVFLAYNFVVICVAPCPLSVYFRKSIRLPLKWMYTARQRRHHLFTNMSFFSFCEYFIMLKRKRSSLLVLM